MTLSLERINARSPYQLQPLTDELSFCFVTEQNLHYTIGFYPDKYFMPNEAYHFFIDNEQDEHGTLDPKIMDVVISVIEEFFYQDPMVMLYICDPTDNRQAARNLLYRMWYLEYAYNHEMTLFSDAVVFGETKYFAGILLRHDHPRHNEILADYQQFLSIVPKLYNIPPK